MLWYSLIGPGAVRAAVRGEGGSGEGVWAVRVWRWDSYIYSQTYGCVGETQRFWLFGCFVAFGGFVLFCFVLFVLFVSQGI